MKQSFTSLVFLAILFALADSAPLEGGHGVVHHRSPHHRLSRRVQAVLMKRPLNLTFTPTNSEDVYVEYTMSAQLQVSDLRFSATLLKLGHDDVARTVYPSGSDGQVAVHSSDTYRDHHVVISAPDPVVRALQQRGVSQADIPQYVRQNMHITNPSTGEQYQLIPIGNSEEPMPIDAKTIMITLNIK